MITALTHLSKDTRRLLTLALLFLVLEAAVWLTQTRVYAGMEIATALTVVSVVSLFLAWFAKPRVPALFGVLLQLVIFFHALYFLLFYIEYRTL